MQAGIVAQAVWARCSINEERFEPAGAVLNGGAVSARPVCRAATLEALSIITFQNRARLPLHPESESPMARRPSAPPPPQPARLTPPEMRAGIDRLRKRIAEVEQFEPRTVKDQFNIPEIVTLSAAIEDTLGRTFGHGTVEYNRYAEAAQFDNGPFNYAYDVPIHLVQQSLSSSKTRSIALLAQAVSSLEERLGEEAVPPPAGHTAPPRDLSKVFVVHGHDGGAREAVARFLEQVELQAIILQEQPDQGLTIIEKFETYASQVGFAVVLLTPDDLGGPTTAPEQTSRARQNVIFELGYFAGKLGRGRACLMRKGVVEIPSDLHGVIYTDMDAADGWKLKLARELKAAGLQFDLAKVFG
jgi:predicted nucleotide-binding protein